MRRGILFFSFLLGGIIFSANVSHASYGKTYPDGSSITDPITWKKSEGPYLVQGTLSVRAELTIESGTVIKFAYKKGNFQVYSRIVAIGAESDPIIFTSERDDASGGDTNEDGNETLPDRGDWLYLNFGGLNGSAEFRHIKILYGGGMTYPHQNSPGSALVINNVDGVSLTKSELRNNFGNAILVVAARPTITDNTIANNYNGIYVSSVNEFPILRNNSFFGNQIYGVNIFTSPYYPPTGRLDARENWWGDASGPKYCSNYHLPDHCAALGSRISDGILFEPWLTNDPNLPPPDPPMGPDPVIVIPGIMGSWKKDGVWTIDPIFHTYDNLRDEFLANGYEKGKSYFEFPYEWRDSNVVNARLLRDKIGEIKSQTGRKKVDIVAHSMGGLLAREYIESDYYGDDVDQLITLGTPQLGAPKDYVSWEAGEFLGLWAPVQKRIFALEALENGYLDIFNYIHERPMKSVEELLPTYDYLYDDIGSDFILRESYPTNYPRNEFLESLNSADNLAKLKDVKIVKIIGKRDNENTVIGYNVTSYEDNFIWRHGYPIYLNIPFLRDKGIKYGNGDETVPLKSAIGPETVNEQNICINSEHTKIPTNAQKNVLEILTGKIPADEFIGGLFHDMLVITVHSPVDIQIESPSGLKIGKNFETNGEFNEIEGGFYTGFNTNSEFITIPNPEDGEYEIKTQGTGEGAFSIEIAKISENPDDLDNANELSGMMRGIAATGEIEEAKIDVAEENIVAVDIQMLQSKVERYKNIGYIENEEEFDYIIARLDLIEKLFDKLETERKNSKPEEKIEEEIDMHIDHLVEHLQKSSSDDIDKEAADLIIGDLLDIKIK